MRKARTYWQETCAVLAILVGLGLAGVSWADQVSWNTNVGPHDTEVQCVASRRLVCNNWSLGCVESGTSGYAIGNFSCGNTIWNSLQITALRAFGTCSAGSGQCRYWDEYWCLQWNIYRNSDCTTLECTAQG